MQTRFHIIKTVHKDNPYQNNWDPGEFYSDANVYELKAQIQTYYKTNKVDFHLYTNETTILDMGVKIQMVGHYDLWGWWNKMLLFDKQYSGPELNIYIDLDTVIQSEITDLQHLAPYNKLTGIYCFWKPLDWEETAYEASNWNHDFKYASLFNSSIMMWHGNTMQHIYDGFMQDREKHMLLFRGNDEYIAHFHKHDINALPRGIVYSYYFGAEQGSEIFARDKDPFVIRPEYKIRMLNGEGKRYQQRMKDEGQLIGHSKDVINRHDRLSEEGVRD